MEITSKRRELINRTKLNNRTKSDRKTELINMRSWACSLGLVIAIVGATVISSIPTMIATAATYKKSTIVGRRGCAAFRNGVLITEWHAAIVTSPTPRTKSSKNRSVVHAIGPSGNVKADSWKNFLKKNEFQGFRIAKKGMSINKRLLIAELAEKIATYNVPYCFVDEMKVKEGILGKKIHPEYIAALRCDGVVEYCYEYYGMRLQGDDEGWDISANTQEARRAHSTLYSWVSPKNQAATMKYF